MSEPAAWELGGGAAAAETAAAAEEPAAPAGLTADEEALLAQLQARRAAAAVTEPVVQLRVEAPHAAMSFGGYTVGTEFQEVPARVAAAFHEAAASAGVTLTQEG
jgi:hypothetical protein